MFTIYDPQGRVFKSSLEELYRVKQALKGVGVKPTKGEEHPSFSSMVNQQAVHSYRQTLNAHEQTEIFHAYQIMQHPVLTLNLQMSLNEARDYLLQHKIRQAPLINAKQHPAQMITLEALNQQLAAQGNATWHDWLGDEFIAAEPITDIRRIAKVMLDYDLNAVPITNDQDYLVGIITRGDLIAAIAKYPQLQLWA